MFKYDSGIMSFLGKVADIVILNLLTLLCCIPIVTIGASLTAAHYTALKMHRDTDNYVFRNFFRSFKANILQSTLIWILWLVAVALSVYAYMFYQEGGIGSIVHCPYIADGDSGQMCSYTADTGYLFNLFQRNAVIAIWKPT